MSDTEQSMHAHPHSVKYIGPDGCCLLCRCELLAATLAESRQQNTQLRARVLELEGAVEVLGAHVHALQEHACDLGEVSNYKDVAQETANRHAANVERTNITDEAVNSNPIARAAVEKGKDER